RDGGYVRLSLVAVQAGQVIGHLLFSELHIRTATQPVLALALAPLAVLPGFQRHGVGTLLMREGLRFCRSAGHRIVVVVGHPEYYPRFGFSGRLAEPLVSPFASPSWMALELEPGALRGVAG